MQRLKPAALALLDAAVRALALFALVNLVLGAFSSQWDANRLWIQGGGLPEPVVSALVLLFVVGVLLARRRHPAAALGTRFIAVLLAVACLADALAFYRLLASGQIQSSFAVPLSLVHAALLSAWAVCRPAAALASRSRTRRALWIRVLDSGAPLVFALVGVLAHILAFGASDYRRPADAAVVLGAAVRADGSPSRALLDRTTTACRLYQDGLVRHLVLSGARDPGAPISEPECMRRIARAQGVPAAALILDETGRNSHGTVRKALALSRAHGWKRVLLVSHDYHLARLQLLCRRAGVEAFTVPARESAPWAGKHWFIGREVLAWSWWYLRAEPV